MKGIIVKRFEHVLKNTQSQCPQINLRRRCPLTASSVPDRLDFRLSSRPAAPADGFFLFRGLFRITSLNYELYLLVYTCVDTHHKKDPKILKKHGTFIDNLGH